MHDLTKKFGNISKSRGAAMLLVVLFFVGISVAILQMVTLVAISELRLYNGLSTSKFAYVAAEAGIEDIFYRNITERNVPASETLSLNGATTTVTIVNTSATEMEIYSTGVAGQQVRKLYMKAVKNVNASFPYGAQVGLGGITMINNAWIDGIGLANGDVYSNGQIIGASGVYITGNAISASLIVPDPTASSTVCAVDETVGRTNPNIDYAQSFTISTTTPLPLLKVSLYVKRNSNPTGANIRIVADNAGAPGTTSLATQVFDNSIVATTYGWVDVIMSIPPMLNPATTYWIVLDATQNNSKYWTWCRSNSDTYAGHSPYFKDNWSTAGAWTAVAGDMTFKITLGGGVSHIKDVDVSGVGKADTIENSDIAGDGYYQSLLSGSTVGGTSYPGSPTPPYVPLPLSSTTIAQWKAEATAGGTINGDCGVGGVAACNTFPLAMGPKKINGNLLINGNSDFVINGTLYVTGNVDLDNNSTVHCAFAYLGNSCVIIADGNITTLNGVDFDGSGMAGSFIMLLSTKQGCVGVAAAGCTTNNSAISIQNNVDGALFYATDSLLDISNNTQATAVVGYKIQLQNNASINYNPTVASLTFTSSATTTTGSWNANLWNEF